MANQPSSRSSVEDRPTSTVGELSYLVVVYFLRVTMPPMSLFAAWEHQAVGMVACAASALIAWAQKP